MAEEKPGAIIIEGHVQGLSNTRSLGEAGIRVYVVDKTDCIARYSRYCQKFFKCPDFILDEFAEFLISLANRENISGWVLIASNDHAVYTLAKHKQSIGKYYRILSPSIDILENIYDKSKLLRIAEASKVPIPKSYYFGRDSQLPSTLEFPLLTKGKYGLSFYKALGKKVFLSNNEDELKQILYSISAKYLVEETFTQELIPYNNTISFTAFAVNGEIKTYWMGVKLREHPRRFGTATFSKSVNIPECYIQSVLLLDALKYTGVCEIEYLLDNRTGEYKLIEINPRTWLWVGLAKECGVDYAKIIHSYLTNEEIKYPDEYKLDIYWINPVTDLVYSLIGILKGEIKLASYVMSIRTHTIINALFSRNDLKPGLAYLLNLLKIYKSR